MKKIFVPTDFSECAQNAINLAFDLAKRNQGEVHIAHGYNPSEQVVSADWMVPFQGVPGTMAPEQIQDFMNEQNRYIKEKFAEMTERAKEMAVQCHCHQVQHSSFDVLAKKAEELGADLVVMGSHGVSGVRETLLGSNTQKFVRHSKIPVLVVKNPMKDFKLYHVAFASTFQHEGESAAYQEFRVLFDKQPVHTHFLLVNTPGHFIDTPTAEKRIEDFLKDTWPSAYSTHIYNDYSVEQGIVNFSKQHDVDLIVMATHGYGGMRRWVYHSTTEQLINHAERPVLSFRLDD